ncbi:hypothetical protein [Allokutzneria albata]|uniref:hypothetical protein n=1 Tax=Allokutzneria albata TaxID=211114 RepID=UPI0012DC5F81|nr:hypothetical protein [Allokutzneria albata]
MNLSELITARKDELELSYQRLADRARKQGLELTASAINQMARRPLAEYPKPETIRALAVALGVPEGRILAAADVSLGFRRVDVETHRPDVETWLALTGDRSPEQIDALMDVVRAHLRAIDAAQTPKARVTGLDDDGENDAPQ